MRTYHKESKALHKIVLPQQLSIFHSKLKVPALANTFNADESSSDFCMAPSATVAVKCLPGNSRHGSTAPRFQVAPT